MKPTDVRKPLWIALVVVACFFVGYLFYMLRPKPEPVDPRQLLTQVAKSIEQRDYKSLLGALAPEERDLLNLDELALSEFMRRVFEPNLEGFRPTGLTFEGPDSDPAAIQTYEHPDGRRVQLILPTIKTADGTYVVGLVFYLTGAAMQAQAQKTAPLDSPDAAAAMAKAFEEEMPVFTSLRIPGVVLYGNGKFTLETWEERLEQARKYAEAVRKREGAQ